MQSRKRSRPGTFGTPVLGSRASVDEDIAFIIELESDDQPQDILEDHPGGMRVIIDVIKNRRDPMYYRALAARALGLLMEQDRALQSRLYMEKESLIEALMEITRACKTRRQTTSDIRKINVSCSIVISMLQTGPFSSVRKTVSLNSPLLCMGPAPVDKSSFFLMETPPEFANDTESTSKDSLLDFSPPNTGRRSFDHNDPTIVANNSEVRQPSRRNKSSRELQSRQKSPFWSRRTPDDRKNMRSTTPSRSVLFGTESKRLDGLDSAGHNLKLADFEPRYVGYDVPKTFFPLDRPSTTNTNTAKKAITPVKSRIRSSNRPRSVLDANPDYAPPRSKIIPPSKLLKLQDDFDDEELREGTTATSHRPFVMAPNHMLKVLQSNRMPLAMGSRGNDEKLYRNRNFTPERRTISRINKLEWSDWIAEQEEAYDDTEQLHGNDDDNEILARDLISSGGMGVVPETRGHHHSIVAWADDNDNDNQEERVSAPLVLEEELFEDEEDDDDSSIDSKAYKHKRLLAILHLPISSESTDVVSNVATTEHHIVMRNLGHELFNARESEKQIASDLRETVELQRNSLPLKFLFELPGGVAFCRERMQRAMGLWIEEFELNQARLAWLQWKAWVEFFRYHERSDEYFRQLGIKRMKNAIQRLLSSLATRGLTRWIKMAQFSIWNERDESSRKIQTLVRQHAGRKRMLYLHDLNGHVDGVFRDMYLAPERPPSVQFRIPARIRRERRELWYAAILVQAPYRGRRFRRFMAIQRRAATVIQSIARMRLTWKMYGVIRRRIIYTQSIVRMYLAVITFNELRDAAILVQINYRGLKGRRFFKSIVQARRMSKELKLSAALVIQRAARGYACRRLAKAIIAQQNAEHWAALVFQRCWYKYNNEWVTFLLLGCLRESDREQQEWEAEVNAYSRNSKAKVLQERFRQYIESHRNKNALVIQCAFRSYVARIAMSHQRLVSISKRKLRWWARVALHKQTSAAKKIQFWWWNAVSGRFLRHLRYVADIELAEQEEELYEKQAAAATMIQALVHGAWTREHVTRIRAAIVIQKNYRGFVGRRIAHALWTSLRSNEAIRYANAVISSTLAAEVERIVTLQLTSVLKITRNFRGWRTRRRLIQYWVYQDKLDVMSRRIQRRWRDQARARLTRKLLELQRRRKVNPYNKCESVSDVLTKAIRESKVYFDPNNSEAGLGVATWLHLLAADSYIHKFHEQKISHVGQVASLDDNELKNRIGIDDSELRLRIFAKANSAKWIKKATELKEKKNRMILKMNTLTEELGKVELELSRALAAQVKVEAEFEEVEEECSSFENPPKGLRKRREGLIVAQDAADVRAEEAEKSAVSHRSAKNLLQMQMERLEESLNEYERLEKKANEVNKNFRPLTPPQLYAEYLSKFPGHALKAEGFRDELRSELDLTSNFQIQKYFKENTNSNAARQNISLIYNFPRSKEMIRWNTKRKLKCCDILQFAAERCLDLVKKPGNEEDNNMLYDHIERTAKEAPRTLLPKRPQVWRNLVDYFASLDQYTRVVQRAWHNRAFRMLRDALRQKVMIDAIRKAYAEEARVKNARAVWEADRAKEAEEQRRYEQEQDELALQEVLLSMTRYPWYEDWDNGVVIYRHSYQKDLVSPTRPCYSKEEYNAAQTLGRIVRGGIARSRARTLRRIRDKARARERERMDYNSRTFEREQWVSVKFNVQYLPVSEPYGRPYEDQMSFAEFNAERIKWEESNVDSSTVNKRIFPPDYDKKFKRHKWAKSAPYSTVVLQLEEIYGRFQKEYHQSFYHLKPAEKAKAEINSIAALLSCAQEYRRFIQRPVTVKTTIECSKVAAPFEWIEMFDDDAQKVYYFSKISGNVVWDRPTYNFDEFVAARSIQSVYRMLLGQRYFNTTLNQIELVPHVQNAIREASNVGWTGFGFEGMNAVMYFNLCGIYKAADKVLSSDIKSLVDISQMSEKELKKLGISKENDVGIIRGGVSRSRVLRLPQSESWSDDTKGSVLALPANEAQVKAVLLKKYGNQPGRVVNIVQELKSSATPVSIAQLQNHIRNYPGKPKLAQEHLSDIMNKHTTNSEEDDKRMYRVLLHNAQRVEVFVANWKISKLRMHLSTVIQIAQSTKTTLSEIQLKFLSNLPPSSFNRNGYWDYDYKINCKVSLSQACVLLRIEALEHTLKFVSAAIQVQRIARGNRARASYASLIAFREANALVIQCAYRVHLAKAVRAATILEKESEYEQLWNDELGVFYYFYHPTEESLWQVPRDDSGKIIPFRPMVTHAITGELIKAWPSLDSASDNTDAVDAARRRELNLLPTMALCSLCHAQEATRVCNECSTDTGDFEYSCFACFEMKHQGRDDMNWHTYKTLNLEVAGKIHCVECNRLANRHCFQCQECYCDRCYSRLHQRGSRASHMSQYFPPGSTVCIECERVPASTFCNVCEDSLCNTCLKLTHGKGKKAMHQTTPIVHDLSNVDNKWHCEQCKTLTAEKVCEYCDRHMCQSCVTSSKHGEICPQFAAKEARKKLLKGAVCVECNRLADRVCTTCGDKYCSIRYVGNPGCFERFHSKGKRLEHEFEEVTPAEIPPELEELEARAKEALEAKKAQLLAAQKALEEEEERRRLKEEENEEDGINVQEEEKPEIDDKEVPEESDGDTTVIDPKAAAIIEEMNEAEREVTPKMKALKDLALCETRGCELAKFRVLPWCPQHCTPQNILTFTKHDTKKAAEIVTAAKAFYEQQKKDSKKKKKGKVINLRKQIQLLRSLKDAL